MANLTYRVTDKGWESAILSSYHSSFPHHLSSLLSSSLCSQLLIITLTSFIIVHLISKKLAHFVLLLSSEELMCLAIWLTHIWQSPQREQWESMAMSRSGGDTGNQGRAAALSYYLSQAMPSKQILIVPMFLSEVILFVLRYSQNSGLLLEWTSRTSRGLQSAQSRVRRTIKG